MAFFEQFGKRVSDLGQGVATKTKNFSEITRLNSAISEQEQQIGRAYAAIGQSYYDNHKADPNAEEQEKITFINDAKQRIAQYQEQIKQIRGIAACPSCGAEISSTAPFCSACGKSTGFVPPQQKRTCPVCGASLSEGAVFCTACGNRVEQPASVQAPPAFGSTPVQTAPVFQPVQAAPQERVCPVCNAKLEPDAQFCTSCGTQVPNL